METRTPNECGGQSRSHSHGVVSMKSGVGFQPAIQFPASSLPFSFRLPACHSVSGRLEACPTRWDQRLTRRYSPERAVACGGIQEFSRGAAESCLHRVCFNIGDDAVKLVFISHPMVIGLVLPECALPSQVPVALVGSKAFQAVHHDLSGSPLGSWGRLPACHSGGRLEACPTDCLAPLRE